MNEQPTLDPRKSTSGRALVRNSMFNLIGTVVPMVVGIVTIPILIKHLGTDRFGIMTIAWMLIGYFNLFDMGMGRALTQLVADKIGKNEFGDIPGIFWTSMAFMLVFSILGAIGIALLAAPLVHKILKVPVMLQPETVSALYIMSFSIPFVILNAGLVGFLTAYHRFDIINAIRIPLGIVSFLAPLIVLPFSNSLVPVISSLIICRVLIFFIQFYYCLRTDPGLLKNHAIQKKNIRPLLSFGGWMTVTNIVGPLMLYFDRFLIGSVISVAAVAYYTTPYELVSRLLIVPASLLSVLFPAFAAIYSQDVDHAAQLFGRATKFVLLCLFPIVLILVAFAQDLLSLWLGGAFAASSYRVLQWLTVGIFLNGLAQVPFTFLQGIGKPDITSKLHILELMLYLPLLWGLVSWRGIEGAAIAWSLRAAIDTVCLFAFSRHYFKPSEALSIGTRVCVYLAVPVFFAFMTGSNSPFMPLIVICTLFLYCVTAWKVVLSAEERSLIMLKLNLIHNEQ